MNVRTCAALLAAVALATAPAAAQAQKKKKATVTLQNKSSYAIHALYMTPHESDDWGRDQLGDHVIEARKGTFRLTDIPCNAYDVRLMDADGDECVVEEVDVCGASEKWTITDKDLLACQGWGE